MNLAGDYLKSICMSATLNSLLPVYIHLLAFCIYLVKTLSSISHVSNFLLDLQ